MSAMWAETFELAQAAYPSLLPGAVDLVGIRGFITFDLFDEHGRRKLHGVSPNLLTQIGDQYLAERAIGIGSPPAQLTGMQLGTGSTAPAKTGAGAAIVTYISGSNVAFDGGFPTSALSGAARDTQWRTTFGAGVATGSLTEVVLINQAIGTNAAAPAANTIARALFSPIVPKLAGDTLIVIWDWLVQGA